ncbi:class I SAM-dependent methyltransferase [Undibacterium sp. Dicai25W]|uniref:class I SAM-dependent methyltransferase n=1 Tax=Undibacterium sp. Dicai25W TaxID=3413034 RepID=UPI003BF018C8
MKRLLLASALVLACCSSVYADDGLKAAVNGAQRTPDNVVRDVYRHPYETLSFFGIRPDMKVVEIAPGAGWYTEILAPYLRADGLMIATANDPNNANENVRKGYQRFKQRLDAKPAVFDKVVLGVFEPPSNIHYADKHSVDMVLTFRNVHNWIANENGSVKAAFQSAFDSLKTGGVFGVVEHRLPENMPQDDKASSGYVHESYVIQMAQSVGFKLAGKSEINANPKDHADHEGGVWALPPTFANKDSNKASYEAIGESDRMTLKFVKP